MRTLNFTSDPLLKSVFKKFFCEQVLNSSSKTTGGSQQDFNSVAFICSKAGGTTEQLNPFLHLKLTLELINIHKTNKKPKNLISYHTEFYKKSKGQN